MAAPTVLTTTMLLEEMYRFTNERHESEFIGRPGKCLDMKRSLDEMKLGEARHKKAIDRSNRAMLSKFDAGHPGMTGDAA
jgi:hypothetical protein